MGSNIEKKPLKKTNILGALKTILEKYNNLLYKNKIYKKNIFALYEHQYYFRQLYQKRRNSY